MWVSMWMEVLFWQRISVEIDCMYNLWKTYMHLFCARQVFFNNVLVCTWCIATLFVLVLHPHLPEFPSKIIFSPLLNTACANNCNCNALPSPPPLLLINCSTPDKCIRVPTTYIHYGNKIECGYNVCIATGGSNWVLKVLKTAI